jgi:hypothetical protein
MEETTRDPGSADFVEFLRGHITGNNDGSDGHQADQYVQHSGLQDECVGSIIG